MVPLQPRSVLRPRRVRLSYQLVGGPIDKGHGGSLVQWRINVNPRGLRRSAKQGKEPEPHGHIAQCEINAYRHYCEAHDGGGPIDE